MRIGEYSFLKDVVKRTNLVQVNGDTEFTSITMHFDGACASLAAPLKRSDKHAYLMKQMRLYRSPESELYPRGRTEPYRPDPERGFTLRMGVKEYGLQEYTLNLQ